MKLDICERVIRQNEICSDIQYCCKWMESMVKQHLIDIDLLGVTLYTDDDRNYNKYYRYVKQENDIIPISYGVRIFFCPFCGEKIERIEKRSSPI